jgi:predicted Zn-dependent protease
VRVRQKSFRRVLILLTCTAALCCAATGFYVHRKYKIRAQYAAWREEGMAAAHAGDHAKVVERLLTYLGRYPEDVEVLIEYARSRPLVELPKNQHIADTIRALRYLVKVRPDLVNQHRELLGYYAQTGYVSEAIDSANALLKKVPNDPQALAVKTNALMRLRRFPEAAKVANEWTTAAPMVVDAWMSRLLLMKEMSEPAEQITALADGELRAHPEDSRFELLAAFACSLTRNDGRATELLRSASKRALPADRNFPKQLVRQLDRLDLADESLAVLVKVVEKDGDPQVRLALLQRFWELNRPGDAVALLERVKPDQKSAPAQQLAIHAICLSQLNRAEEATPLRAELAGRSTDPLATAWALVLEQAFSKKPVDAKRLIAACEAALEKDPADVYLRTSLGENYVRVNELERAISTWQTAARDNLTWPLPLTRLSDTMVEMGRYQSAVRAVDEAVRRSHGKVSMAVAISVARARAAAFESTGMGRGDEILAVAEQVQAANPGEEQTLIIRAGLLTKLGRAPEAAQVIGDALKGSVVLSERTLLRLAVISRAAQLNLEEACYERAQRDIGFTPDLASAKAMRMFAAGKGAAGLEEFEALRGKANDANSLEWQIASARYLDVMGHEKAKDALRALADAHPADLRVQQIVLSARTLRQEKEILGRAVQRVRDLTGEQAVGWRVARARWLLDFSDEDAPNSEAVGILTDVVRLSPDLVDGHFLLARALERSATRAKSEGDRSTKVAAAINHLTLASNLSPNSISISLYLARLLQSRGDFERARETLDRLGDNKWQDVQQRLQAATLLAQQGQSQRAIQLLEEVGQQGADDSMANLLLANLFRQRNDLDRAQEIIAKMIERKPDVQALLFAADLQASRGRVQDGLNMLSRLSELKVESGYRELAEGDFLMRYADLPASLARYEAAARINPKNPVAWKAVIASHIAAGSAKEALAANEQARIHCPDEKTFQAINQYASMLSIATQNPDQRVMAIAFVRDPSDSSAAGESLRVITSARQNNLLPEQLTMRLAPVADRHPRFLPLQILLARTYVEMGRHAEAVAIASRAAQLSPQSAEPLRLSVGVLASAGRWAEVIGVARDWRERSLNDPLDADLALAEAYVNTKQPLEAMKQLEPYLQRAQLQPDRFARVLPVYARAQQETGKTGVAEVMAPLLQRGPQGRQTWMVYAVQNLEELEAKAWLDRAASAIPADAAQERTVLSHFWGELFTKTKNRQYLEAGLTLLRPSTQGSTPDANAWAATAMLHERESNFVAAEAAYRAALKLQPALPVVQNNLAMVLARSNGNLEEARSMIGSAIKAAPEIAALYDTLSFVERTAKNLPAAIEGARTAVRLQPSSISYHLQLAELLLDDGRRDEAVQVVQVIVRMQAGANRIADHEQRRLESLRKALGEPTAAAQAAMQ